LILFSQKQLRNAVSEYVAHYHEERNHQGMGSALLTGIGPQEGSKQGEIVCGERLGGLLRYYHRQAIARQLEKQVDPSV